MAGTKLTAHANTYGYVYLNIPKLLCEQCGVAKNTTFVAVIEDGHLVIRQEEPCLSGK